MSVNGYAERRKSQRCAKGTRMSIRNRSVALAMRSVWDALAIAATEGERFWSRVERRDNSDCWQWRGRLSRAGYGYFDLPRPWRTAIPAHRIAYSLTVGSIPPGLHLDHLCRNRTCVNPAHLEAVTPGENTRRAPSASTRNAAKETCPQGHLYDDDNTYLVNAKYGTSRICKTCHRDASKQRRDAARELKISSVRICACGCGREFVPGRLRVRFHPDCAARRLRESNERSHARPQ